MHSFISYLGVKAGFIWKTKFFCLAAATPAKETLTELQQLVVQQQNWKPVRESKKTWKFLSQEKVQAEALVQFSL